MRSIIRRTTILSVAVLGLCRIGYGQSKPIMDDNVLKNWQFVRDGAISNDGKHVIYSINNSNNYDPNARMVLKNIGGDRELVFPGADGSGAKFSKNSGLLIFECKGDTIKLVDLQTYKVSDIPGAYGFSLIQKDNLEWLFYRSKNSKDVLFQLDLKSGRKTEMKDVQNYWLSKDMKCMYVLTRSELNSGSGLTLAKTSIPSLQLKPVWQGEGLTSLVLNDDGSRVAFSTTRSKGELWYYDEVEKVRLIADSTNQDIPVNMHIADVKGFSPGGQLLFGLRYKPLPKHSEQAVMVDVWSYRDIRLQPQQLKEKDGLSDQVFTSVIDLKTRHILHLQDEYETTGAAFESNHRDYLLLTRQRGDYAEHNWNPFSEETSILVSLKSGEKKQLPMGAEGISPKGTYLFGRIKNMSDVIIYKVASGKPYNITEKFPIPQVSALCKSSDLTWKYKGVEVLGWYADESRVLLGDDYDLWLADPTGKIPPECITGGYGRQQDITFRLAEKKEGRIIHPKEALLLTAFNHTTKESGYYSISASKPGIPHRLTMGPYKYNYGALGDVDILKSAESGMYLFMRCSPAESPNYYCTRDFKTLIPVSHIAPEKNCKWLKNKLISFESRGGVKLQGILYYPEDFDSTRKYPVIFHYYERMSDELFIFPQPALTSGLMNIPWFVSRDYLVFTPDIEYTQGYPGESALQAVEGAADLISKLPYVDSNAMGLQGHSFSGYETNYIITHSKRFTAAVAGSGVSDLISNYNSILEMTGFSRQFCFELTQYRVGKKVWDSPELYLNNSPVMSADKVTTPLLLMNNRKDGIVSFSQGAEMFIALRRLGKKAWLLQYDDGGHHVNSEVSQTDYTKRIEQFFDHYLKRKAAPVWMTRGIEAKYKGLKTGYEYDTEIKTPGEGLLMP